MTDEEGPEEPREGDDLYDELAGPQDVPAPGPAPGEPSAVPVSTAGSGGPGNHRARRRAVWPWVFLGLLLAVIALVAWTKTVNSDSFCTRCHSMQAAADTAAHSVHSDVSCISCHRGVGVKGAVAYVPTFMREVVDQLTPLSIASGTMDAAACESCHDTIFTTPLLEGEHPSTGCEECHGNTIHPEPSPAAAEPISNPHPADWIDYHGREANRDLNTCATCHLLGDQNGSGTCMACHFKGQYPHPTNWIPQHGQVQIEQGSDACTLCHAPSFCASCHGTEIPHGDNWLSEHPTAVLQKDNRQQCLMCHVPSDCTFCHVRHAIHPEQGLFYEVNKP